MNAYVFTSLSLILVFPCEARVELRLFNGKHKYEGRVEAFVDGKWGPISAKSWDKKAAQVVCRQLGFSGQVIRYTKGLTYGHPRRTVPVWLSRIDCKGTETELGQCDHSGWTVGKRKLNFYDLAGVMCYTPEGRIILPQLSIATGKVERDTLKIRLDGKKVNGIISEGILKVSYEGQWGQVCTDGWDYKDMRVTCGHLGFPDAVKNSKQSVQSNLVEAFLLNNVNCLGNESSLFSCDHGGLHEQQCSSGQTVWLKCKVFNRNNQFKNSAKLKLRGAAVPSAGRIELIHGHAWANLCDDKLDMSTANVICRSLGYGTAYEANLAAPFGLGSLLTIVEHINCTGFEKDISECKWTVLKSTKCSHFEDAGVKCNAPKYQANEVRLRGGRNPTEGRVEIKVSGRWGTVCGDNWNIKAAMIVCRELGSNFAQINVSGELFSVGQTMVMSGTICLGDEVSLTHCLHDGVVKCSSPNNVAGVRCVDALPDLALSIRELFRTLRIDYLPLSMLRCAYEENCLASTAKRYIPYENLYSRRLMRFSSKILNHGSADYRPLAEKKDWIWHSCHKHYHSQEEFAVYDLLTPDHKKVAEGHKASFCLEDTSCINGVDRVFNCSDGGAQGISVNCFDNYAFNIDCQWIDVTDIQPYGRSYIVKVNINPWLYVAETDFDNNVIACDIVDKGSFVRADHCAYDYCTSGLRSHGGNSNQACCVFPFKFKNKTYETCTKSGFDKFWCSTTADYDKDKRWGIC